MNPPRRLRSIVKLAEQHGWTYSLSGGNHPMLSPPRDSRGRPVIFSLTPSDHRSDLNCLAEMRRQGLPIPRKNHKKKGAA